MEIVMLTTAGAIRMDGSRSDERRSRQVASQSVRRDLSAFDKPWSGQDRVPPYDHRGATIVAGAWLAFYVITAIHHFISSGN
jgi:hypothetical protein